MTNIWQVLLQTAEISLTVLVLLLVKWIFRDKLSPRWQYGIWVLLALKVFLPAGMGGRYISMRLAVFLEAVKSIAEQNLDSVYSGQYVSVQPALALPWVRTLPESLTDWLFIIYIAGVLFFILRYSWGYAGLRKILRKGRPASDGFRVRLETLCEKYGLRPCRAVQLGGISSAFVCGVIRPVLVIPEGQEHVDEKILLHELLHIKYGDMAQGVFWCAARCLQWCNPLMWYAGSRIACDMESLCDQRVLERLSGEDRRDYGRILLSMTNEKYASAVGTTSLASGGKSIAKRIRAIAYFKKYPRGMALVSVCIGILLAGPVFGSVSAMEMPQEWLHSQWRKPGWDKEYAMAASRIHRCSTQAGAVDSYLKGVINMDAAYMAAALPAEKQGQELEEIQTSRSAFKGTKLLIDYLRAAAEYCVYNLDSDEKSTHHIQAVFRWANGNYNAEKSDAVKFYSYAVFPLKLDWDGRGWTAESDGTPYYYETADTAGELEQRLFPKLPWTHTWKEEGENGTVRIDEQLVHMIAAKPDEDPYSARPDAEFTDRRLYRVITFQSNWDAGRRKQVQHVSLRTCPLAHMDDEPELKERLGDLTDSQVCVSNGPASCSMRVNGRWDGSIEEKEGCMYMEDSDFEGLRGYAARIFIDGENVETFKVKRGDVKW